MNARRAARELALIALAQVNFNKVKDIDLTEIMLNSVRTLVNDAEESLKTTVGSLVEMKEFIDKYELEHPDNLERPLEAKNLPVPIPLTSDMSGRLESLINVAEKSFQALEVAEVAVLLEQEDVKTYALSLLNVYRDNKEEIDEAIANSSKGWGINRLLTIDKSVLRIAIAELTSSSDVPVKVAVDEAIELAKKYGSEESSGFINGILGNVIQKKEIKLASK